MKTHKPKIHWTNKLAILFSFSALAVCCVNIFVHSEKLRFLIWTLVCVSMMMNFWSVCYKRDQYFDWYILKSYESDLLKWSYLDMANYIKKFDIPELADIDIRIENELNDIEIKKQNYAKQSKIKKENYIK